jgi:hypothetical protein
LNKEVYRHGKLYVALSRVTNKEGLKLLVDDSDCPSRTARRIFFIKRYSNVQRSTRHLQSCVMKWSSDRQHRVNIPKYGKENFKEIQYTVQHNLFILAYHASHVLHGHDSFHSYTYMHLTCYDTSSYLNGVSCQNIGEENVDGSYKVSVQLSMFLLCFNYTSWM